MCNMETSCQEFEVTVHTSPGLTCGTYSHLSLSLIGSQAETPPITVSDADLLPGSACPLWVQAVRPLGRLLLIRLRLNPRPGFPDMDWHCDRVEVKKAEKKEAGPEDPEVQVFLCDRWLQSADGDVELRTEKMCLLKDEAEEKLKQQRLQQLQQQQKHIRWLPFVDCAPHYVDVKRSSDLGPNLNFTRRSPAMNLHYLKGFTQQTQGWNSFTELDRVFKLNSNHNKIAEFVRAHWMDDGFFGYQSLNGLNPLMLRQTRLLPPHLSVTSEMLRPFLPDDSSLEAELQKGAVYLLDYELMDGLPANVINGRQTYLCAPLCLLHLNQQGALKPIAIQLQQTPGPLNPVFLPSDLSCDWLLAKLWVRCADFQCHQLVSHYLRTHMMGELCCGATLRTLPQLHPLHQLLMPHVQTSLQINIQARASLLAANGVFDKAVGCGLEAVPVLISRAGARIRYRSLCVPDDLADRSVDKLPQSYYAQDAQRVWDALHRFVVSWMDLFYRGDDDVQQDSEIQHWIAEINSHGFTCNSGFPESFQTRAEVSKFVTMIIFSCSALHAAVNFSQLDFSLWMPNSPAFMLRPPPQAKGLVTEEDILSFLPDVKSTCHILSTLTVLSQPAVDYVPLCHYREAVFNDGAPRRLVKQVQEELQAISDDITDRNSRLDLPYPYLCPQHIENSVAI
ncbi:polyunsaturated fatty acid lipoxygenase ALOX15B [Genypterus blacodes]|uniref:polyunsaturated fatty acid lipoxygenase ALOX15B n=1 Tax=Genypterus blacodes TaxID=154954 RepID=UPI003F75E349